MHTAPRLDGYMTHLASHCLLLPGSPWRYIASYRSDRQATEHITAHMTCGRTLCSGLKYYTRVLLKKTESTLAGRQMNGNNVPLSSFRGKQRTPDQARRITPPAGHFAAAGGFIRFFPRTVFYTTPEDYKPAL